MSQVLVASNRGPLGFHKNDEGNLQVHRGGGGLAAGLLNAYEHAPFTWYMAAATPSDVAAVQQGLFQTQGLDLSPVVVPLDIYDAAYDLVSNQILWRIHHGLFDHGMEPSFDRKFEEAWDAYVEYNRLFATEISKDAPLGASVICHDYHLCLLPKMLRDRRTDLKIVHFSHTPFANSDEFEVLPKRIRRELIEGMASADTIGFHSERWRMNFLSCLDAEGLLPGTKTFVSPLAPSLDAMVEESDSEEFRAALTWIKKIKGEKRLILRVDRIEPSKNILRGFQALEEMLDMHPETAGNFVFLALCYPSRETLESYRNYKTEVENAASEINERWSSADWLPIVLDARDDYPLSLAGLASFDALMVNPIRDGLNLVALEGLALNTENGRLILSENAGAHEMLSGVAISVNPFDLSQTAAALYEAAFLDPPQGRQALARRAKDLVTSRTPAVWLKELLGEG